MSEYFDLSKQIRHLVIDKSVMFSSEELIIAEKMLRDNSYHYFVNCSKIKQAEFFEPNLLMYKTALFGEWWSYFEMDCRVSLHLMDNLVKFERTINSRISHYISKMIADDEFSNFEKNAVIQIISQTRNRKDVNFSKYNGSQTWFYISKMTFGEMKQLVFWLYENKRDVYEMVVERYSFLSKYKHSKKRFDELNKLRNSLFHLTPLSVYLTEEKQSSRLRPKIVKWVSKLSTSQEMKNAISEICFYADNYVKIKNSLPKQTESFTE